MAETWHVPEEAREARAAVWSGHADILSGLHAFAREACLGRWQMPGKLDLLNDLVTSWMWYTIKGGGRSEGKSFKLMQDARCASYVESG